MIFSSLFPVFAILGLGFVLTKANRLSREVQKGLNALAFYVGLPALLFHKIGVAELGGETAAPLFWSLMAGTSTAALLGLAAGVMFRFPKPSIGALAQASFRGNLAFIAFPIILYATSNDDRIATLVVFTMVPAIIVYNLLSVVLLVFCGPPSGGHPIRTTLIKLATNPLLIGCFAGLAWNAVEPTMPLAIERLCDSLGRMAFPMALLGIGSQIARTPFGGGSLRGALLSSVLKNVVAPLVGYAVARFGFGLEGMDLLAAVVLLATPTAVSSYVMADQMDCDSELAATAVATSSICSIASFGIVLWLLG